jgi:NTP pyrophosphatase (non-canonical NTP hydrolase)
VSDEEDCRFLSDVGDEVVRAREKFPSPNLVFAALVEEVGELAQAMLKRAAGKDTYEHIRSEAVQVAAMALRVAVDGDPSFLTLEYVEP